MKKIEIKKGQRFDRLVVLKQIGVSKNGYPTYLCKCDCGKEVITRKHYLTSRKTHSCGCLKRDIARETQRKNFYKHGLTGTRIFEIYRGLKKRCLYKHKDWDRYGGRGISICKEWLGDNGAKNFYNWSMSNGYRDDLTIDRIDVNGNYCPENCRWATVKEQQNNKTTNHYIEYNSNIMSMKMWCDTLGLDYNKVRHKIYSGRSIEIAFKK